MKRRRQNHRRSPRRRRPTPSPPPQPSVVIVEQQRRESELEKKFKSAAVKFLEVVERDPERMVSLVEGVRDGVEKARRYATEHPEAAKKDATNTVIALLARIARKSLASG